MSESDGKRLGDRVDGRGFDRGEFTEDERAMMRHRNRILDDDFLEPEAFAKTMGLAWVSRLTRAVPAFAKLTAIWAVIGSAVAWLQGWFPWGGAP